MTVKEFIGVFNYNDFEIYIDKDDSLRLTLLFKINQYTPLEYISDKLLNAKISKVEVNEEYEENESLFVIVIDKVVE